MFDINTLFAAAIEQAIAAAIAPFEARLAALEAKSETETARIVSLLDVESPQFVEAVENIAERVARDEVEEHTSNYDHDQYDDYDRRIDSLGDPEDVVRDELRTALHCVQLLIAFKGNIMNLYYVTAYHCKNNEWWRFAVSAADSDAAVAKFKDGYSDTRFTRVNAVYVCPVEVDVFTELT